MNWCNTDSGDVNGGTNDGVSGLLDSLTEDEARFIEAVQSAASFEEVFHLLDDFDKVDEGLRLDYLAETQNSPRKAD